MVAELTVDLGERSYPVYIGPGLLETGELLTRHLAGNDVLIVTNEVVAPLYLDRLSDNLVSRRVADCVLPDGEAHKTLSTVARIFDLLAERRFHRDATIVSLGGGVIGDIAGFTAACYQRGIAFVQIPTTLLAQVDAAVGGKTAVNHPLGKNLIGAFHQPRAVIADIDCLATLPRREYRAGLAEVVKYGLIGDAEFFAWLEAHLGALLEREPEPLVAAILRSCQHKAAIVAEDEREEGNRRALLNLGHTFAHALETATDYGRWLHGEAVAIGLVLAAELSHRRGTLAKDDVERIRALLVAAGLPVEACGLQPVRVLDIMRMDKKVAGGRMRLVLLDGLGAAEVVGDVTETEIRMLLDDCLDAE